MRVLTLALLLALFSCNGKEEILNQDDVLPQSDYQTESKNDSLNKLASFIPSILPVELELAQIKWDSVTINEELTVPERFSPEKTEKFIYWVGDKSVEYSRWAFRDSTKSMKAFLNWMNCYGEQCFMVELRSNVNIQRNAVLIMQTDTAFVQIQSASIGVNELKKWKKLYFEPKDIKWNYIVMQPKGGKAIWSSYKDKEELEFVHTPSL